MKICFVSIDVESDFAKGRDFSGVENIEKILNIFKKHNIKATLFVTGNILEKYQNRFKELSQSYEIASHGFSHKYWNELDELQRRKQLKNFAMLYETIFNKSPKGFRAPSHIIDQKALETLSQKNFLYDSSVVPNYPFFKKYRGYKGRAISKPYFPNTENYRKQGAMEILEIPVTGLFLGIPLVGTWIRKLPFFIYRILLIFNNPGFLALSLHSWDSLSQKTLDKIDKILRLLKDNGYQFLNGYQIYEKFSGNKR